MSELEKQQRAEYQQNRKKKMLIQSIIIIILTLATLITSLTFYRMNKDTYVYYTENGCVDYKVFLKDNEFYTEEFLDESHAYVPQLIEKITADFAYDLKMETEDVEYKYSYKIDAQLEIKDKDSNMPIFNPKYTLVEEQTRTVNDNALSIKEPVEIDYAKYNELTNNFLTTYEIKNTVSTLIVKMYINVVGVCEEFAENSTGEYVVELNIPLAKTIVNAEISSTVPQAEEKILACENSTKNVFKVLSIIFGAIDLALIIAFAIFVIVTRDKHIDYARKVKKLVNNYKSYIQQINNLFNPEGYQILRVNTFTEMLEIRDTLQTPILMYENKDQTATKFIIPTCTKLLYLFEIKVEGLVENKEAK